VTSSAPLDPDRHLRLQNRLEKFLDVELLGPSGQLVEVAVVAPLPVTAALRGRHHHEGVLSVATDQKVVDSRPFRNRQLHWTGLTLTWNVSSLQDSEAYASLSNAR